MADHTAETIAGHKGMIALCTKAIEVSSDRLREYQDRHDNLAAKLRRAESGDTSGMSVPRELTYAEMKKIVGMTERQIRHAQALARLTDEEFKNVDTEMRRLMVRGLDALTRKAVLKVLARGCDPEDMARLVGIAMDV
jgi:hypothetical protein